MDGTELTPVPSYLWNGRVSIEIIRVTVTGEQYGEIGEKRCEMAIYPCIVPTCPNSDPSSKRIFRETITAFSFPNDKERYDLWCERIGIKVPFEERKVIRICQNHFAESMFTSRNKTRLIRNALPSSDKSDKASGKGKKVQRSTQRSYKRLAPRPRSLQQVWNPSLPQLQLQPLLLASEQTQPLQLQPFLPLLSPPLIQPILSQPLIQPILSPPLIQPILSQPLIQPILSPPLIQPILSQPILSSVISQPLIKPPLPQLVLQGVPQGQPQRLKLVLERVETPHSQPVLQSQPQRVKLHLERVESLEVSTLVQPHPAPQVLPCLSWPNVPEPLRHPHFPQRLLQPPQVLCPQILLLPPFPHPLLQLQPPFPQDPPQRIQTPSPADTLGNGLQSSQTETSDFNINTPMCPSVKETGEKSNLLQLKETDIVDLNKLEEEAQHKPDIILGKRTNKDRSSPDATLQNGLTTEFPTAGNLNTKSTSHSEVDDLGSPPPPKQIMSRRTVIVENPCIKKSFDAESMDKSVLNVNDDDDIMDEQFLEDYTTLIENSSKDKAKTVVKDQPSTNIKNNTNNVDEEFLNNYIMMIRKETNRGDDDNFGEDNNKIARNEEYIIEEDYHHIRFEPASVLS